MKQNDLVFNEERDIQEVDQFGFIDLAECLSNGEVPTLIDGEDVSYNGIEDPSAILGKPDDIFSLYRMNDYVQSVTPTEGAPSDEE